jgi:Fic family protein
MHHVLARRGFNPAGLHFPVSAAILDEMTEYKGVLESYSTSLLSCVQWEATQKGNVKTVVRAARRCSSRFNSVFRQTLSQVQSIPGTIA